ncbi:MAG: peptidoglycan DD-metalloendopeptidase family protein [Ignavibacteriaceae bacterium]|nr:peptidoglycan DD-metalloendopeptidase family protein [Ignavibacteriaceae bacterium]
MKNNWYLRILSFIVLFCFTLQYLTAQLLIKPIPQYPTTGGFLQFGKKVGTQFHIGSDFSAPIGTPVVAPVKGILYISKEATGFGGANGQTGGVQILKCKTSQQKQFFIVIGHLKRNLDLQVGDTIQAATFLGEISDYISADGTHDPHLHLGCYLGSEFPLSGWGYQDDTLDWENPQIFLASNFGNSFVQEGPPDRQVKRYVHKTTNQHVIVNYSDVNTPPWKEIIQNLTNNNWQLEADNSFVGYLYSYQATVSSKSTRPITLLKHPTDSNHYLDSWGSSEIQRLKTAGWTEIGIVGYAPATDIFSSPPQGSATYYRYYKSMDTEDHLRAKPGEDPTSLNYILDPGSEYYMWQNVNDYYPPTFVNSENGNAILFPIIAQNYPNPFNPNTRVEYGIPEASHITIILFDILGRYVKTLVNESKSAGSYNIEFNASNLTSGVYFYAMQVNAVDGSKNFREVKKMILMK